MNQTRFMLPFNEFRVAVLACCWQCGAHLDTADVPWWECETCGMAWLVSETIVERIDFPDHIKGVDPCTHPAVTIVTWDGDRYELGADEPIPHEARSMEFMFERRTSADLLAAL